MLDDLRTVVQIDVFHKSTEIRRTDAGVFRERGSETFCGFFIGSLLVGAFQKRRKGLGENRTHRTAVGVTQFTDVRNAR